MMKRVRTACVMYLCMALLLAMTAIASAAEGNIAVQAPGNYVIDLGVYHTVDEKAALELMNSRYDGWTHPEVLTTEQKKLKPAGCTAVSVILPDGTPMVGRNFDYYYSERPAFVGRVKAEGFYETIFLSHPGDTMPDFDDAKENGINPEYYNLMPFAAVDVMNEKGLYIEDNMRSEEYGPNGEMLFSSPGTNPDAELRLCAYALPQYLAMRCATVDEAVELAKSLNLYSVHNAGMTWPFCYFLSDAEGNYGVLELGQNTVHFLKGNPAQTNFYLNEDCAKVSEYGSGLGRREYAVSHRDEVKSEHDLYKMMSALHFSHYFDDPAEWELDWRSEIADQEHGWTTARTLDENHREELLRLMTDASKKFRAMTEKEKRASGGDWISVWTTIANCRNKTLTVHFNEDDVNAYTFGFEK